MFFICLVFFLVIFAGGGIGTFLGGATAGGVVGGFYETALNNATFGTNNNVLLGGLKGAGMAAAAGGLLGGIIGGIDAVRSDASFWNGKFNGEVGGEYTGKGRFLDEEIPAGAKPTKTGEIAKTHNPNYGKYGNTRTYSNGDPKPHFGVDYAGKVGDNVNAMYSGTVDKVGHSGYYGPHHVRTSSMINGKMYNVDYGHLSKSAVTVGQKVTAGDLIGYMGREGMFGRFPSYAPTHVHIAVWRPLPGSLMGFVMPHW